MDRKRRKIVVLGAGSAAFGLNTLVWLIRNKDLKGMEIVLVDIAEDRLFKVQVLARLLNDAWSSDMKISSATDYRKAILGANYIIISVATDRIKAWEKDINTALKYGITHFGENGGPGGFIHAARNISLIHPMLEGIKRTAPDAFILNFSNPMQRICTAINKLTPNKFVGICHQIHLGYFILGVVFAQKLGLDLYPGVRWYWDDEKFKKNIEMGLRAYEKYSIKAGGLNHFTWFLDILERGSHRSVYDEFIEGMKKIPESMEPLTKKCFDIFGYVPLAGDNHITEYLPYTSSPSSGTYKQYDIQSFDWGFYNRRKEGKWKKIEDVLAGRLKPDGVLDEGSENAEKIIAAIEKNKNEYFESLNIPNRGSILNLPEGSIVDIPCVIGANGVSGIELGRLPRAIAELCRRQLILNDMTVEAVIKGDVRLVYQLMALDPMVNNLDTAKRLADEYIKDNIKYLPTFR